MDPFNQTIIEPHKGQPIVIMNMKLMSFIIISMLNNVVRNLEKSCISPPANTGDKRLIPVPPNENCIIYIVASMCLVHNKMDELLALAIEL